MRARRVRRTAAARASKLGSVPRVAAHRQIAGLDRGGANAESAPHANDALLPNASKTLAALAPLGPQAARPVTAAGRHR
ncbi:Uncharacterised protein [Burkholderia pseudomallei]|nr:Uncharacterised protein [Burkholderia pseudomallei]